VYVTDSIGIADTVANRELHHLDIGSSGEFLKGNTQAEAREKGYWLPARKAARRKKVLADPRLASRQFPSDRLN
jgi:hypothetical protein